MQKAREQSNNLTTLLYKIHKSKLFKRQYSLASKASIFSPFLRADTDTKNLAVA